jgi:hypothetical protein
MQLLRPMLLAPHLRHQTANSLVSDAGVRDSYAFQGTAGTRQSGTLARTERPRTRGFDGIVFLGTYILSRSGEPHLPRAKQCRLLEMPKDCEVADERIFGIISSVSISASVPAVVN